MEILDIITVGWPFCGFKIIAGLWAMSLGRPCPKILGALLLALGVADVIINTMNLATIMVSKKRLTGACLFSVLAAFIGARWNLKKGALQEVGDSLDIFVAFVLVAGGVGFGLIALLPPQQRALWGACTVLNVMGAGLSRLGKSIQGLSS